MKGIGNFFKDIGNFLNKSVEYFDERVRTGKFIGDLKIIFKDFNSGFKKNATIVIAYIYKSAVFQSILSSIKNFGKSLTRIPLLGDFFALFFDTVGLLVRYYTEFFLIFAVTFPSAILLLNFFETSTPIFFLAFFPVIFFNTYCIATLYYCIEKKSKNEKITLWKSFEEVLKNLPALFYQVFIHTAIVIELVIGFAIVFLFYQYFFDAIAIAWSGSFYYWFFIVLIGTFAAIAVFIITIIMHQAFFLILFDKKKFHEAFHFGWKYLGSNSFPFIFYYLLFNLFFSVAIFWAGLYHLYIGIAVTSYAAVNGTLFLGFLLRRKLSRASALPSTTQTDEIRRTPIFLIFAFFGIINYILAAVFVVRQYDAITTSIQTQRENYFFTRGLLTYNNSLYGYSIDYPQGWSVYEWQPNEVTFYNNYTGTVTGGVWFTITVSAYDEQAFQRLFQARPGLVSLETATNDITTKVSNFSVQDNDGVSYTFVKDGVPYPEFQTHYLIHRGDMQYDLKFTTLSKNVDGDNSDVFEKIVASFKFNE